MQHPSIQQDPLDSPHPIPWGWVLSKQAEVAQTRDPQLCSYRGPALISPGGHYAAYSRIQMQAYPDLIQCRVNSTLFVENLQTRDLQPLWTNSALLGNSPDRPSPPGSVVAMMPISWSENSDRLLTRDFEASLGSDFASDYAVVWDSTSNCTRTLAPSEIYYTHAILLGWSRHHPDRVLFRAGIMGQADWQQWTVDLRGRTLLAPDDQPVLFGSVSHSFWLGLQV